MDDSHSRSKPKGRPRKASDAKRPDPTYRIALDPYFSAEPATGITLEESEARYRALVELAPIAIAVHANGEVRYVNPAAVALLRASDPSQILGRSVLDFVHPDSLDDVKERIRAMYALSGPAPRLEERLIRFDGTSVEIEASASLVTYQGTDAIQVVFMDISERKAAEARIQEQQAKLARMYAQVEAEVAQRTRELQTEKRFIERIINNAPMAIVYLNREHRLRWFNPEFVNQVRRDAADLLDRPVFEVWPPAREYFTELLDRLFKSGEVTRLTSVPYTAETGTLTYWDLTLVPVMDVEGYVDGIVSITIDATGRVEAEKAHLQQIETLQQMDKLKDNFINTVTHELRTPLTAIMGYCEFLEDHIGGDLTASQEEFVQQIKEGGARLKRLVDDLLDFARLEAGAFKLTPREFDLSELIREEVEALVPTAEAESQTLRVNLPDVVVVTLDPDRIGQVVRNLVGNAIKFTPKGGRIEVRLASDGTIARVEVNDTGPGIDPELHPRVFEKFFQADPSLTRLHGGAGLGLAISKSLIEAHGGHIGFDSRPGDGSSFWFELPLTPPDAAS